VLEQEDGNAVVGSPSVEQGISLVKCRVHHNTSNDDEDDCRPVELTAAIAFKLRRGNQVEKRPYAFPNNG
jgi:hypothetical protein